MAADGPRVDCPHGMPSPAACTDCMFDGPVAEPARWRPVGRPSFAVYDGVCIGCDATTITVGDRIQRWDKGHRTAYLHDGCTP